MCSSRPVPGFDGILDRKIVESWSRRMYESIDASSSIPLDRFSTRFSGEGGGGEGESFISRKGGNTLVS